MGSQAYVQGLPSLLDSLLPKQRGDGLEVDELWSFVERKDNAVWLWTALCRRTRQIVAFVLGDRSADSCRRLWEAIPSAYRRCRAYSDFWQAYEAVFPQRTHHLVGKETGLTAHQDRWYNTLRQCISRFVRKTLSFSKSNINLELVTRWFIIQYNLQCQPSLTSCPPPTSRSNGCANSPLHPAFAAGIGALPVPHATSMA
jgi:insertion element IS1 protein InsB